MRRRGLRIETETRPAHSLEQKCGAHELFIFAPKQFPGDIATAHYQKDADD